MRILNFTEQLIKPALQDKSKCFTIRKAWDWLDEGQNKKACWREQEECRHKVGALRQIMWNQRKKINVCENCWKHKPDLCDDMIKDYAKYSCFSKVFGVGKILQTPKKIWMYFSDESNNGEGLCILDEGKKNYLDIKIILHEDGFKNIMGGELFFVETYPIITREWMPFWRINWEWQK